MFMKLIIEGEKIEGVFVKRHNRFVAEVAIDGVHYFAHVPNTGRMKELLLPGARVLLRKSKDPLRKTPYDLLFVYKDDLLVAIDSGLPNRILKEAFEKREISYFKEFTEVKREVTYGKSRFDFSLNHDHGHGLVEAKCVTLVKEGGLASFPDAPTLRGTKHVLELIEAKKQGIRGAIIFIVQREDAIAFTPNTMMDPAFGEAVRKGKDAGIEFYAFKCQVTPNFVSIDRELDIII